jgi:hypothetical protein
VQINLLLRRFKSHDLRDGVQLNLPLLPPSFLFVEKVNRTLYWLNAGRVNRLIGVIHHFADNRNILQIKLSPLPLCEVAERSPERNANLLFIAGAAAAGKEG